MAILTPLDQPLYFPEVQLSGTALVAALARAQMTAESAQGANRPLERHQHTEIRRVQQATQACQLTRLPIALVPLPSIEGRSGGFKDGWGRLHRLTQWEPIDPDRYQLDLETGRLTLLDDFTDWTEIRATYYTGFDFALDSIQTREIKAAVAAILSYQTAGR